MPFTLNILFFIILLAVVIIAVSIIWPLIIGAAWSPTSTRVVLKMLEMAEVRPDDVVYDLGSGDGRIVIESARKYRAKGIGIEADPLRVIWSRIAVMVLRLNHRVKIIWGDIFRADISEASVVTVFLWQRTNTKLKKKLQRQLRPGTRVVSYIWTFEDWIPVDEDKEDRVYLYIIGRSNV